MKEEKMRKIILFTMMVVFSVTLCVVYAGGSGGGEKPEKEIVWKMSHVEPIDSSMVKATQDFIFKEITERTDGMLKFEVYPDSVLGNEREVISSLQQGSVEMASTSLAILGLFVDKYLVFPMPFLWSDKAHFDRFKTSSEGKKILEEVQEESEEAGFMFVTLDFLGYRMPNMVTHIIKSPDDFKGAKMRTMENDLQISTMKALGANPVPIPWNDVYNALKMKVVDGWYNDPAGIRYQTAWEVAPYLTEVPLFCSFEVTTISKKAFDALPSDYQKIVLDVFKKNADKAWEPFYSQLVQMHEENIPKMEDYYKVEDVAAFQKAVQPVWEDFQREYPWAEKYIAAMLKYK
jgi:TRAP-type C4-dicarboxylate transport system substrate-binding protein